MLAREAHERGTFKKYAAMRCMPIREAYERGTYIYGVHVSEMHALWKYTPL
jgi:hypothetical protein